MQKEAKMNSLMHRQNGPESPAFQLDTEVVHASFELDHAVGALVSPISVSTTFSFDDLQVREHMYSRLSNPSRSNFEKAIAACEKAKYSLAFSSGMAAISAILRSLPPGAHVIRADDLYGGTTSLLDKLRDMAYFAVDDFSSVEELEEIIIPGKTKLLFLESLSNPLLKVADVSKISSIARKHGVVSVVDNTFVTPVGMNALKFGADIVLNSVTKYINGHSDVVMGVLALNNESLHAKLSAVQREEGSVPGPFDCFLANRGLKTLAIRMRRHEENALRLATLLESHYMVTKVLYPGLKSHPQHELAKKQMSCYSGMISFYIRGGLDVAAAFLRSLRLIRVAVSLGSVETLIEHPALMTHKTVTAEKRKNLGISDDLLRLSVGIEHIDDLISDVTTALKEAALAGSIENTSQNTEGLP